MSKYIIKNEKFGLDFRICHLAFFVPQCTVHCYSMSADSVHVHTFLCPIVPEDF